MKYSSHYKFTDCVHYTRQQKSLQVNFSQIDGLVFMTFTQLHWLVLTVKTLHKSHRKLKGKQTPSDIILRSLQSLNWSRIYLPFMKSELLDSTLNQLNPIHMLIYCFIRIHFNITFPSLRRGPVGIATSSGLWAGRPGFDYWKWEKFFFSPQRPNRLWGPPSLLSNG
jgi:hypothetical protein